MSRYLVYSFFLMFLSPVLTVIRGLKINYYPIQRGILILGITFYGSTINLTPGSDGYRHQQNVYDRYLDMPLSQFLQESYQILTFQLVEGTKSDLYIHSLSYFVGSILHLPQLFFVFVAFIYAYFFAGSILKVVKLLPDSFNSYLFYAFAVIFVLFKNVEGINTVRTWTALWVLFYGAINYFETKRLKYLLLCFVPPLIHLGYFVMAVPAWLVLVAGNRFKYIWVLIYFLSFVTSMPQAQVLEASQENEVAAGRMSGYYVEDVEEYQKSKTNDGMNVYKKYTKMGLHGSGVRFLIFAGIIGGLYFLGMNKVESGLFSIGMMMMALSNWTNFIFALSSRSALIGCVFVLASFVLLLKRGHFHLAQKYYKNFYLLVLFASLFFFISFVVSQISNLIYFTSLFMLALPFVPWLADNFNVSIREFLSWF